MYLCKDVNEFDLETKFNAINNDDDKLTKITKAVFAECDTDENGYLVKAELKVAMASVFRKASIVPPSDAQVEVAMASVFRKASIYPPSDAPVEVTTAGVWRKTSIVRPSDAQVDEVFKDLGTDSSGTVTLNGFKKWV